jgi:hypothetical protein
MVEVGADAADLVLAGAAVGAKRPDQVVDLAGAHAVQVGLHHHRELGLIHPPAPLQQRQEEGPGAQLGMRSPMSPAEVASTWGWPLRWASRSGVRWCGAAPSRR